MATVALCCSVLRLQQGLDGGVFRLALLFGYNKNG
jgi:hypothetical protein